MKKNLNIKRKGFTLVELLIVIVVIGVLSAMMMLSSTEAVTSAKASNIVSNLRNLKTAALAYYVDNYDAAEAESFTTLDTASVLNYMSSGSADIGGEYTFTIDGKGSSAAWFVNCKVTDTRVRTKLQGRAKSVGLLANATSGDKTEYSNGESVHYRIR